MNTSAIRPSGVARVAVAGGGLIGLSIAWRLAQSGYAVQLFERGTPGSGASFAAAGMLSVVGEAESANRDFFNLCRASRARWPAFAAELEIVTGRRLPVGDPGTLLVARTDAEERNLAQLARTHAGDGTLRPLARDEWRRLEPSLSDEIHAVCHAPEDGHIDNRAVIAALVTAFLHAGGELRKEVQVERLILRGGRVTGVQTSSGPEAADHVVLAAGVGTEALLAESGLQNAVPSVTPVKGQMIAFDMSPDVRAITHVVRGTHVYLVPRPSGRLLAGATSEPGAWDTAVTAAARDELHEASAQLMPALARQPVVDHWAGLRPFIAGGLPRIGPVGPEGLLVAIGHYRNGVLLTPITADIVAGIIGDTLSPADQLLAAPFGRLDSAPHSQSEHSQPAVL